jgi:hypothetical protein
VAKSRYQLTRKAILDAFGLLSGDVKVAAVSATYTYSTAHDFLNDLSGVVATSPNLTTKTTTGGVFTCDPFTFTAVAGGSTITAFVVYLDTGSSATSPLLAYLDTKGDATPVSIVTDGGDIVVTPNAAGLFAI